MRSLKIYLGDLTYDTITIATESFPLNIGFIASTCLDRFDSKVDITLFKYIEDLENAIQKSPPDILGLSNYAWNKRVGSEIFKILITKNPDALKVWGGPNFPVDLPSQEKFMKKHLEVDIYVPGEGEIGFLNIVARVLETKLENNWKNKVLESPIDDCIIKGNDGKLQFAFSGKRLNNLDEIPSPYSTDLLDKFFDGRLTPMLQTNRGCPFTCTFCTDGSDLVSRVNQFSMERVISDLNYIATHVPKNTSSLFITDLNFGMIPRDLEICKEINKVKQRYGYPEQIQATTGKNAKERIVEAVHLLSGSLRLYMSVQSMDKHVLENIRRSNISLDQILALTPSIKKYNLRTTSEVILGLPGESKESHMQTLRDLTWANLDDIQVYSCMLLDGSEMNLSKEREKWGLRTKFRVLPRDFVKLSNGKNVIEIEEIVISSNTLSFEEYIELRLIAFAVWVTSKGLVYDAIIKFLREQKLDVFELFYRISKNSENAQDNIQKIFSKFRKSTIDELWDSPEEIEQHYAKDAEFEKLLNGEAGINVMYHHQALVTSEYMDDWTECVIQTAYDLLDEGNILNEKTKEQFLDVANYCRGLSHNPLGSDRRNTVPEFTFSYNISDWLKDNNHTSLGYYKLPINSKIKFILTDEQINFVQDKLNVFGSNIVGKSQAIKRIPITILWRRPVIIN